MKNRTAYGYFDDERNEYVITRPDTPTPWINMLGESDRFTGVISNTAGGYTYHIDPANKRITRYHYIGVPEDRPGRYLYLKDRESGDYWSTSWQPVLKRNGYTYECRHGMGYTTIAFTYAGVASENTYVVPLGQNFELWRTTIRNVSKETRRLSLFAYNEWCLWNMVKDTFNAQAIASQGRGFVRDDTFYFHPFADAARNQQDCAFTQYYAFFACSNTPDSVDFRRDKFIGPYRNEGNPVAIEQGRCSGFYAPGGYHVAAAHHDFELRPDEERTFLFALGTCDEPGEEQEAVRACFREHAVDQELAKVKEFWSEFTSVLKCSTPDEGFDVFTNVWNPYLARQEYFKKVNYYYTAWNETQYSFRDHGQKAINLVTFDSAIARDCMETMARLQFQCGDNYHSWSRLGGPCADRGFSDDPLWFVYLVYTYVRETGDLAILDQSYDFVDGGNASLYEHAKLCCDWTYANRGTHGLPRIGTADWNDCINLKSEGESEMVACQFVLACHRVAEIADLIGKPDEAGHYREMADAMKACINETCWDGQWYVRAFDIQGNAVGSAGNEEGKIFLNAQTWAVISGVAEGERARQCLDSVHRLLFIRCGLKVLTPSFSRYDPLVGAIGVNPKGLKENGGVFCHAHTWGIIAACVAGDGDRAFAYYRAALPYYQDPDIMKTEPYAFAQFYASDEHPEYGLARNSWHTGTIPWTFIAATQYILGIRPSFNGLEINPCIPREWDGFKVRRIFRGTAYDIDVQNPEHVSRGVRTIELDGKSIESYVLPHDAEARSHEVKVVLGAD